MSVIVGRTAIYPLPPKMPIVPYEDMPPFGGTGRSPYANTGNALRRAACFWRRANPLPTTYPSFSRGPLPRTVQRLNDNFWERLCPDVPPPPQIPEQPFFGGQCPALYRVVGVVRQVNGLEASDVETGVPGPILSCDVTVTDTTPTQTTWAIAVRGADGQLRVNPIFSGTRAQVSDWWFRLERQDGQPDTCGDAPIVVPTPTQPPQVQVNVPITIGGQQFEAPVIATNIEINPDNTFEFSPVFNFDGVPFRILPEGVDIDINPDFSIAPQVDVNLNVGSVGGALGNVVSTLPQLLGLLLDILDLIQDGGGNPCDLEPLARYIECLLEKPNAQVRTESLTGSSIGGVFPINDGCIGVSVNRNEPLQPGTKIQSGAGNLPNVEFWGWFAWGSSGNFTERTPLNYRNQFLIPPKNVNQVLINPTFANTFSALQFIEENSCQFTP